MLRRIWEVSPPEMISSMGCGSMASYDQCGWKEERDSRGDGTDDGRLTGTSRRDEALCFGSERDSERRRDNPPCRAGWAYLRERERIIQHSMIPNK